MVDNVSLLAIREAIAERFIKNFSKAKRIVPAEWAETVRRLPEGRRFRWSYAPYLRKMFESIFDPMVEETILELFSRAGKSEVVLNAIGYFIDQEPRRILSLWPTEKHAEKFSKDNLVGELFDPTVPLQYLGTKASRRTGGNTILHKLFPGGLIDMFGANAPGDMRRAKGNLLYADEIDAIQESESDEGDQLAIFNKRGDEYPDTIKVFASYPSLKGKSRVHAKLEESDWQKYFVTCARCGGEPFVMVRSMLRYDPARPQDARLECPRCSELLNDDERYQMMLAGDWKPTREFRGKRGFQAGSLLWPHPINRAKHPGGFLQMLAQKEIDVSKNANPERAIRVLVNTEDAEPFQPEIDKKPEASEIEQRREEYDPSQEIPADIRVITVGGDCQQAGRIELEFVGHGEDFRTWGLGYKVLYGSLQQTSIWRRLDELLLTEFNHPLCGKLKVAATFIDEGHALSRVLAFTRPRFGRKVFACKGSSRLGVPVVGAPTKIGRPPAWHYMIGTHEAKDMIYQRLELVKADGETMFPIGYMHFPKNEDYGTSYFKGLTAEDSTLKRGLDGDWYRFFECDKGVRNEPLDCRVYAMAAERKLNPNYDVISQKMLAKAEEIRRGPSETPRTSAPQQNAPRRPRKFSVKNW